MSDLKMNFDKLNKACKEVNEKWGNMMKENNPFDTISKIAKDIADRQDKEVALEFTKHICTLLKNNGVSPMIDEYKQNFVKENSVEQKYGVAITGLDFTEHDKRFRDEIMQLKSELSDVQKSADEYYNKCIDLTKQVTELESELEVKDNLLKIKNGLCKNELPNEITIDGYKCEIIQTEQGLYISRDRIYEIIDREKKPLKDRCAELEDRHQQDCITINQLQTTIDVLTTRYAKLKGMNNY